MYGSKSRTLSLIFILFGLCLSASPALALNCSNPTGGPGSINESYGYRVCNGSTGGWETINTTATSSTCSKNKAIDYEPAYQSHKICSASYWNKVNCGTSTVNVGYCSATNQLEFSASDGTANDNFGKAVAVTGQYMAVGAPGQTTNTGAVYIYKKVASSWQFMQKVTASDASTGSFFGYSVSVNGATLAIGAYQNTIHGAVYVFTTDGTTWTQQQKLLTSTVDDTFGKAVTVYNNTLISAAANNAWVFTRSGTTWSQSQTIAVANVVSVSLYDDTVALGVSSYNTNTGAVYIYRSSASGTFSQEQQLSASDAAASNYFGASVSVFSGAVVIGSYGNNAAYYFTRSNTTWTQQKKLTPSDTGSISFGTSISLYSNYIMVGAPTYSVSAANQGAAYVFHGSGSSWSQLARQVASDYAASDSFGQSVAFYGTTAVAGAYNKTVNSNASAGVAYIIPLMGLKQTFNAGTGNGQASGDGWGSGYRSIAMNGNLLAIGAYTESTTGAVFVFYRDASGTWNFDAKVVPNGSPGSEKFGTSVAISGNYLLVGAPAYNSSAGAAYLYTRSGTYTAAGTWTAYASNPILGSGTASTQFGQGVSIDNDTLVIGESGKGGGTLSGDIRIYTFNGTTLSTATVINRPSALSNAHFGESVSIKGNTILVGSPGDNSTSAVSGAVWVFNRSGTYTAGTSNGTWDAGTSIPNPTTAGTADNYGQGVWLDTNYLIIGRPSNTTCTGCTPGADIFTGSGTSWSFQQTLTTSGQTALGNGYGYSVSIYNDQAVVGCSGCGNWGYMYYFTRGGTTWTAAASFTDTAGTAGENYGETVAIENGYIYAADWSGTAMGNIWYYSTQGDPVQSCYYGGFSSAGATQAASANPSTSTYSLNAGQSLLVCLTGYASTPSTVTFNGTTLTPDTTTGYSTSISASIYSYYASSAVSNGTLSVTMNNTNARAVTAAIVNGLTSSSFLDKVASTNGGATASTSPSSGLSPMSTMDQEFVFGCIGQNSKSAETGTWSDSMTSVGYTNTSVTGGSGQGSNVNSASAYKVVNTKGQFQATKTGTTSLIWAAAVAGYKTSVANSGTTTTCSDNGSCSIAGQMKYSSTAGGMIWCDGSNWRLISSSPPAALGTFNITGMTGGTDVVADATLTDTPPTVNFGTSTNSSSYTATIKSGASTICTATGSSSPIAFSGCTLTTGNTYTVSITATDGVQTLNASNNAYSFTYNQGGLPIAPVIVQNKSATSGTASTTNLNLTFNSSVTAGHLVVLGMTGRLSTDTILSVTGLGATWTRATSASQNANNLEIWYGYPTTSGTTITINNSSSNLRVNYGVEVSGCNSVTVSPGTASTTGGWTMATGTLTSSNAPGVYFGLGVVNAQATESSGPTSPWTDLGAVQAGVSSTWETSVAGIATDNSTTSTSATWVTSGTGTPTSTARGVTFTCH